MIRANTAENLRAGSKLPLAIHKIRPSSLPSLSINQDPKVQVRQNTELHLAVANRQFEVINRIVSLDPKIVTIKNKQGETAADWFIEYLNNFFQFKDADVLESLPKEISSGNVDFLKIYFENDGSRKIRFSDGNTLLHLAIEYHQIEIIKLIQKHYSPQLMSSLLAMENIHEVTPKELSNKLNNPEMIKLLQDLSSISIQPNITIISSEHLVPPISKHLFINIKKSTDLLTDLCCASYWILTQSLKTINTVTPTIEELLTKLFMASDIKSDIIQLQKNISEVNKFFKELIQKDSVHQKIKLSTEGIEAGWTYRNKDLIYINLSNNQYRVEHLITTLIHEASHLIHFSYDIKYCEKYIDSRWIIDFRNCEKLLENHKDIRFNLTPKKLKLLKIQYLLEGKKSSFNNWLAHRNADTFAVSVLGLAALGWNCATVEGSLLSINGNRFLTALSDYSHGHQLTTEPRSPDPYSETLLSPIASSDHPENHNLLRKISRAFRKTTRKPPSNPSTSSNASTAASSSPPGSPESDHNQRAAADLLTADMATMKISKNRLHVFPSTSSTSPPDQIFANSDNLLKTGRSSPFWTP